LWKKLRKIDFLMIENELSRSACMGAKSVKFHSQNIAKTKTKTYTEAENKSDNF
jgi:hypothetical protein